MASFDDPPPLPDELVPPPRPSTPAVRWSFILVLLILLLSAVLVYGIPYMAFRAGYSYESGRARAASESLASLDKAGIINRASELFRSAAAATSPAVVSIQCLRDASRVAEARRLPPNLRPNGVIPSSFGSGVIVNKELGYIVTNAHVVDGADEIQVRIGQGQELVARLVGADSKTDLAVLQVAGPLDAEAQWADMSQVDVGDWVLAIGSPFMLEHSVSVGIVSAIGRRNLPIMGESGTYQDFVQTDAAINPGNSGGPLVDLRGRIVGINTAIYNPREGVDLEGTGGNVGIGFALSATLAQQVVEQIVKNGRVVRGYMGVILDNLDSGRARQLGMGDTRGALVVDVDPDSPAAASGVAPGDVIVGFGDKPVRDLAELRNHTAMLPIGSTVELTMMRGGAKTTAQVGIATLPLLRSLGLRLSKGGSEKGVQGIAIDGVQARSPAWRAGLRPGQRLVAIENRVVEDSDEAEAVAERFDPVRGLRLDVLDRGGNRLELTLGTFSRGGR